MKRFLVAAVCLVGALSAPGAASAATVETSPPEPVRLVAAADEINRVTLHTSRIPEAVLRPPHRRPRP